MNLIPLNPTNGYGGGPSQREVVAKFVETLRQFGVEATVRVRRGIDIDAGCGQLAAAWDKLELPSFFFFVLMRIVVIKERFQESNVSLEAH